MTRENTITLKHHILLIGLPTSGKTTIAAIMETLYGLPLYDTDKEIEKQENNSIQSIFETKGELYFRKQEETILLHLLQSKEKSIIASGGGAYESKAVQDKSKISAFVVWLKITIEDVQKRIRKQDIHPLFKEKPETLEKILEKREKNYRQCHIGMEVDKRHRPQDLAQTIMHYYQAWVRGEKIP